jgi:5'-nucleotidase/UDP-sugar diphosphatase
MKNYLLCLFALVLFCAVSEGKENNVEPQQDRRRIVILYTNDEHGWMEKSDYSDGCAAMMGLWRQREGYTEDGPFLILSGGDNWTGPAISTWFKGQSMVEVMNAMDYSASAIGNHEFDFTTEILKARIKQANFEYLSANIREKGSTRIPDFVIPYIIRVVNGIKIGIIGLTTTSTPWSTFPDYVKDYDFINYDTALREIIPDVKQSGVELIVVLGHICQTERQALVATAQELDISVITGGHCHKFISEFIQDIILIEAGSFMGGYGKLEIIFDKVTKSIIEISQEITLNRGGSPDSEVEHIVSFWKAQLDASLSNVIGYASEAIERNSFAMHNMITDSWLYAYPTADVSLTNSGGIRQPIPSGDITLETMVGVLPFENSLLELELTGAQIINCMGNLLIGGMRTIDGYYLSDGTPVALDSVYHVLTTDYLYSREDYDFSLYDPTPYNTSIHYRQPVIDWIKSLSTSDSDPLNNHLDNDPRR